MNAEILTRSRPDPEIRQKIHKILQKALRDDYIDVSVIIHSVLDNTPIKKDSDLIPGVKIKTDDKEIQDLLNYRLIVLTVNKSVDLNQVEIRVRSEISELKPQDRFEQSIVLEKLNIEPDAPKAYQEAVKAINEADALIIGPGSLFTSILPNLLIPDINAKPESNLKNSLFLRHS